MDLSFLKSTRFYKLLVVGVTQFLSAQGIIEPALSNAISLVLLGSVAVKTIDKFSTPAQ